MAKKKLREKKIQVWELPSNGFTIYSRYDDLSRVSGVGVKVGSIYDPPGMRGMAHLYEHLVARRTRDVGNHEFDLLHEKYMGGPDDDVNISTGHTSMFFGHTGTLRMDYMLKLFHVMAGFARDRLIDQEGFDVERAAVFQETYLRGIDTVDDRLNQLIYRTLYERNPVRNRIDCEPSELGSFLLSKARQFGRRYFVPRNMFMVMLGPSHDRVVRLAEKYFGDLPDRGTPRLDYDRSDDVPVLKDVRYAEEPYAGTHQFHVAAVWPTETTAGKNGIALDVLARLLRLRLTRRLREENRNMRAGAYRNPVETERTFVHGLIQAWFATTDKDFAMHGHDVIAEEAAKLRTELVAPEEFDAAVTYSEICWLDAFRYNADSLCEMIIEASANGDDRCEGIHSFQHGLRKLTRKKLREVANQYLKDEHVHAVITPACPGCRYCPP